ncbi:MAG TPA: MMPL family transporter [Gemmatimonadaceae bacterium]|nr:MMPL family transporter [Gemmatimonadaceae bacterium]
MIERIATAVVRHRCLAILLWIAVAAVASLAAPKIGARLGTGGDVIEGTESARAAHRLESRFARPLDQAQIVTLETPEPLTSPGPTLAVDSLSAALARVPFVTRVDSWRSSKDSIFLGRNGRSTFLSVALAPDARADDAMRVDSIRAVVRRAIARTGLDTAQYRVRVTGNTALDADMRRVVEQDSRRAELQLMPITLVVLVVAFGALVAALIPVIIGMLAIWIALALISVLATITPVSVFVLNITTMLGLGVGIDYSLLIVTRFREELAAGLAPRDAAVRAAATAGRAVTTSGVSVVVGFGALLLTPLTDTQSVGMGGLVVVGVAVILAITLLPALLATLGHGVDAPRWLVAALAWYHDRRRWRSWAQRVTARPVTALVAGLLIIGSLTLPLLRMRIGLPASGWFPASSEAGQGVGALERMGVGTVSQPIHVLVQAPWKSYMTSSTALTALGRLADSIAAEPGVRRVTSVASFKEVRDALPLVSARKGDASDAPAKMKDLLDTYMSRDGRLALIDVVLQDTTSLTSAMHMVTRLRTLVGRVMRGTNAEVLVGGFAAESVDLQRVMLDTFPTLVGLVLGATALMLAASFRSLLVPFKAVILNSMSVAASFGLIVLVFQEGWGVRVFHLAGPTRAIFVVVPVLVFAIVFGLSMDYEVFLLARIKEAFDRSRDNTAAVAEGLSASASTITSAALIMILVFGAFAFAQAIVMQFIGFGLAAAVLLDATVVRMLLVPAIMQLAGDWNWWPGTRLARLLADHAS